MRTVGLPKLLVYELYTHFVLVGPIKMRGGGLQSVWSLSWSCTAGMHCHYTFLQDKNKSENQHGTKILQDLHTGLDSGHPDFEHVAAPLGLSVGKVMAMVIWWGGALVICGLSYRKAACCMEAWEQMKSLEPMGDVFTPCMRRACVNFVWRWLLQSHFKFKYHTRENIAHHCMHTDYTFWPK